MYRLLTVKRLAVENSLLAVYGPKKHVVGLKDFVGGGIFGRRDVNAVLLQPAKHQSVCNEYQKSVYCHLQQNLQLAKSVARSNSVGEKGVAKAKDGDCWQTNIKMRF